MYITQKEYMGMGGNQTLENDVIFRRHEMRAEKLIDRMTHGRIRDETPVRHAVKMAMFELIEASIAEETEFTENQGREIASMANDGVSVSYAVSSGENAAAQRWNARKCAIIQQWMEGETTTDGVQLLYAGVF